MRRGNRERKETWKQGDQSTCTDSCIEHDKTIDGCIDEPVD